jgi:Transposase IS4
MIILVSKILIFRLFLLSLFYIYIYITNTLLAPSIPDDSTADKKLNSFLIPPEEAAENFENCLISEILRPLPDFKPIPLNLHNGRPQNLDLNKHWHPLALFQLFFSWNTMSIIVKETNSFAFCNNSLQNPWISLSISELYHFFGCLLLLSLHKQPPRAYSWQENGVLSKTPLSKNRFEQIVKNLHFKDRGLNPVIGSN